MEDQLQDTKQSNNRVAEYLASINILAFMKWYVVDSIEFWYRFTTHLLMMFYDLVGLSDIFRHFFAPYRRDYTFVGYFVGIVIRFFWVIGSVIMLTMLFLFFFALSVLYYIAPVYLLLQKPLYFVLYVVMWVFLYAAWVQKERHWQTIKSGTLTSALRRELWERLELNPQSAQEMFHQGKDEFVLFLQKNGLTYQDYESTKHWLIRREWYKQAWKFWMDEFFIRRKGIDVGWFTGFLSELKKYSVDLTAAAAQGHLPHSYGRERELHKIITVLERPDNNNVLLVGPAGVGKTSLVYAIAWMIIGSRISVESDSLRALVRGLEGMRVIELNVGGLVGGQSQYNSIEARLNRILAEIRGSRVILFFNQLENLIQAGVAGYLSPLLGMNNFPIIATTTPRVFEDAFSGLSEFISEFEVVRIEPPSFGETIKILEYYVDTLEKRRDVFFTYNAIKASVELSEQYMHDSVLPDKAIKVLIKASENRSGVIRDDEVAEAVSQLTDIPVGSITQEESSKLLNLEQLLRERIVGQEEAIREIARALRRARTNIGSKERPIASLLFLGPTGVGKTWTSKTLAQVYFSPEEQDHTHSIDLDRMIDDNFIQFDMSEYSEPGAVDNFLERATKAVNEKPFSLLLLDEFEKAEENIHNLFLQIFEEGRLTNEFGETVDFRNTIIIATSNAVQEITSEAHKEQELTERLEKSFRPELINRFDGIVLFHKLLDTQMEDVVELELTSLKDRLFDQYKIKLSWTDELRKELAMVAYDPDYGARPLRRMIQNTIEDRLAQKILREELSFGDDYVLTVKDLNQ